MSLECGYVNGMGGPRPQNVSFHGPEMVHSGMEGQVGKPRCPWEWPQVWQKCQGICSVHGPYACRQEKCRREKG